MKLGLKVDVTTSRGVRIGVPRLMELFSRYGARATFFFALGPDRLLQQSWLPGTQLGRRCGTVLREVREAGFEVGIQSFDPARWIARVAGADQEWTQEQMEYGCASFMRALDMPPPAHAASRWCMNRHAYRLTQRLGFRYCSDTRGIHPYIPVRNAEIAACPQLPTTLPTLDELARHDSVRGEEAIRGMLRASADPSDTGHIYTVRAEWEGIRHVPLFDELLAGWRSQGYTFAALEDFLKDVNLARLPRHAVTEGTVAGCAHRVALQGPEFLA